MNHLRIMVDESRFVSVCDAVVLIILNTLPCQRCLPAEGSKRSTGQPTHIFLQCLVDIHIQRPILVILLLRLL